MRVAVADGFSVDKGQKFKLGCSTIDRATWLPEGKSPESARLPVSRSTLVEGRNAMNLVPGAILLSLSLEEVVSAQPASRSSQQTQLAHQLLSSSRWIEKPWGAYLARAAAFRGAR